MPQQYEPNKEDYHTYPLSDRLAITINAWDGRAILHYLTSPHIKIVIFTPAEVAELTEVLIEANIREV